jgi:uncharacterized protein (DUF2062 family)
MLSQDIVFFPFGKSRLFFRLGVEINVSRKRALLFPGIRSPVRCAMNVYQIIKIRAKDLFLKAKRLEGDPHFIALGFALGVFVGVTPTIPFHTVLAVSLAFLFKGSKAAAAIGVWIGNPITIPFFYLLSYRIGTLVFVLSPFDAQPRTIFDLMKMGMDLTAAMVAGGVILGIVPGGIAYWVAWWLVRVRQKKHAFRPPPSAN